MSSDCSVFFFGIRVLYTIEILLHYLKPLGISLINPNINAFRSMLLSSLARMQLPFFRALINARALMYFRHLQMKMKLNTLFALLHVAFRAEI